MIRLAGIDASPIGGGPITRAVESASREAVPSRGRAGTVRLFDLFIACCSSCRACSQTGRCTSASRDIEDACDLLASADMLVLGVPSHLRSRDPRAVALLRRLIGGFAEVHVPRGGERAPRDRARKVAALISSAPPLMGALAQLGLTPTGLSAVWHFLDRARVEVVATASVAPRWSGPAAWDKTSARARAVGRALTAAVQPRPVAVPAPVLVPQEAPIAEPARITAGTRIA